MPYPGGILHDPNTNQWVVYSPHIWLPGVDSSIEPTDWLTYHYPENYWEIDTAFTEITGRSKKLVVRVSLPIEADHLSKTDFTVAATVAESMFWKPIAFNHESADYPGAYCGNPRIYKVDNTGRWIVDVPFESTSTTMRAVSTRVEFRT